MGRLTIKQWGAVVAAAITVGAVGVSANMIWDGDIVGATNVTMWGGYAYYYLEGYYNTVEGNEPPNHHKPCFATKTCRTEFSGMEEIVSAKTSADADGEWPYKGGDGGGATGGNALILEFKGLSAVSDDYTVNPEAGVGLLLTPKSGGANPQGIGAGFDKVTKIKWKMKMTAEIKQIRFKIETLKTEVANNKATDPMNNAYGKVFENTTPDAWMDAEVAISGTGCADGTKYDDKNGKFPTDCKVGDLTLADWFGNGYKYVPGDVTKIAWAIATGGMQTKNASLEKGTVWIDKIEIVGYDYQAPDICSDCVKDATQAPPSGAWKLSDLEPGSTDFSELAQNAIGQYWYYYNDQEVKGKDGSTGSSDATEGIREDEYSPTGYSLDIADNKKGYNSSNGAWIKYLLGPAIEQAEATVPPFVGLGTEVFHCDDPDGAKILYDAGSAADAGVYFLYQTSFDNTGYLSFEAHDEYAYLNPDGGEVYGVRLPGTKGAWKSATIPFSKMLLPSWAPKDRTGAAEPFNKNKIAKFQFKVEGVTSGDFAVDNVYVKGADSPKGNCKPSDEPPIVGIRFNGGKAAKALGIRATYGSGVIGVNWNAASSVASGKIALVNTKGRVVASAPITAAGNKVTAKLGAGNIPTGMYFVRITARDVNGKNIVKQTPVSVVK